MSGPITGTQPPVTAFPKRPPRISTAPGRRPWRWVRCRPRTGPAGRLLHAAGTRVTTVDIDELGPELTVARIGLDGPAGPAQVTTHLAEGLALALEHGAPIRVADTVMDNLAQPLHGEDALAQLL